MFVEVQITNQFLNLYNHKTKSFIHSKQNPIVESDRFAIGVQQTFQKEKFQTLICYGFGLGYNIEALLKIFDSTIRVICIEPITEVLNLTEVKKKFLSFYLLIQI